MRFKGILDWFPFFLLLMKYQIIKQILNYTVVNSKCLLVTFETDYQGLTKNFCHGKIYCSSITANLVNMKIGVPWDRLQILPLNQKITIAGVSLTCFDANHCPGAIIILFEPPNGKVLNVNSLRIPRMKHCKFGYFSGNDLYAALIR